MKKGMLVMVLFGLLAGFSFAADTTASMDSAKLAGAIENYKLALKSENRGVRSSAMYMLALMKSQYPEMDIADVKVELGKLSRRDDSPLVRVHANLVLSYLNSDSLMAKVKVENPQTPVTFYSQLVAEMTASPEGMK